MKKVEHDKADNYRGIILMNTAYTIYAEVLKERLEAYLGDDNIKRSLYLEKVEEP